MKRPKRENYPNGVFGDIDYTDRLNRYCSFLENKMNGKLYIIDCVKDSDITQCNVFAKTQNGAFKRCSKAGFQPKIIDTEVDLSFCI